MTPSLQKCPTLPRLQHSWGAHHHHRVGLLRVDPLIALQVVDVSVFERVVNFFVESLSYFGAEHVYVSFINIFAFLYQVDGVVYVNMT